MTLTEAQREALKDATVAYYTFDNADVSGSTIFDLTPNNNDGTIVGATTGVTGILNQGFSFDGANDEISVDSLVGIDYPLTINAWINPSTISITFQSILAGGNTGSLDFHFIARIRNAEIETNIRTGSSQTSGVITTTTPIIENQWQMVTFVINSPNDVDIYHNANVQATSVSTGASSSFPNINNMNIGLLERSTKIHYFDGLMDEVAVFNKLLTQEEVTYLFNNGNPTRLQQFPYTSTTQAIQGTVTLDGNPVEGADVRLINTTDDIYIGSFTTPADGTYSFTNLLSDKEYHTLVQYKDGSNNEYNTLSLPFLSPEEVDDV